MKYITVCMLFEVVCESMSDKFDKMLVQFLNEVLGACQNVRLHVVDTFCDMGTNDIKALKLLGATIRKLFF